MRTDYSGNVGGETDFALGFSGGAHFPRRGHFFTNPSEVGRRVGAARASKGASPDDALLEDPRGQGQPRRLRRVGHTPLVEFPELSDYFGLKHLTIKDESRNPFGTHKDRKSFYAVSNARRLCGGVLPDALCILTSGNAGLSLAAFAAGAGLPVTAVTGSLAPPLRRLLESACREVLEVDLNERRWSSRRLQALAGEREGRVVLDVTNCAEPYLQLLDEIVGDAGATPPDVILLPVGGGELFIGLAARIRELGLRIRLIGVTVADSRTRADKLYASWTPHRAHIRKLTGTSSPHRLLRLGDEASLMETFGAVRPHLRCEPSSAAAFEGLRQAALQENDRVTVVNTGTFSQQAET